MQRYLVLKDAESKGVIQNLQKQVKFELIPKIEEDVVIHLKNKRQNTKKKQSNILLHIKQILFTKKMV